MVFCSKECRYLEAAVLKQRVRRTTGADRETRRKRDLSKKYGITVEDWDWLWAEQNGRCAACQIDLNTVKVCVDHDHKTNEVRGLLCNECNHGLGKFKDDAETLMRAAQYVLATPPLRTRKGVVS
jgi:hypothetical protein